MSKQYTEDFIAHALDMLRVRQGNLYTTARALNISRATLRDWRDGKLPKKVTANSIDRQLATGLSAQLADKAEEVAMKALEAASDRPDKIDKASFKDLLIGAQNAITTAQLLRGGPTSRSNVSIQVSLVATDGHSYSSLRAASQAVLRGEVIDVQPVHKALEAGA